MFFTDQYAYYNSVIMSLKNKLIGRKIKFNCLVQPNLI